jgi:signal transduction histidine kinase
LSIAGHELKTPLTALQLQIQSVQDRTGALDGKLARKLERIARSSARLAELIEALLDVSRLATGRFELNPGLADLTALVNEGVEHLREAADQAGCALQVHAPPALPGVWDRLRIEQLLSNLLSNAFKYGAGSPVEISLAQEGDAAILRVSDGGPGIPEGDLERIFGRFERATSMRHYGGLGLGLYVARQIAEAHGGAISATNQPGGGACFTIRLPLKPRPTEPR